MSNKKFPRLETEYISVVDMAIWAGFHPNTIRSYIVSGGLHAEQRKEGGQWRINKDCGQAWLEMKKCKHQEAEKPKALNLRRAS